MKTKIIALLLLMVLAVSVLSGCVYNYQNKDLSAYATVDADALYAALQALVVEDGDFTSDPAVRKEKTLAKIAEAVFAAVKDEDKHKKTTGTVADGDYVSYLYYRMTADGKHIVSTDKMGTTSDLLLHDNEGVAEQIQKTLLGMDIANLCEQITEGDLPTEGMALVSYTYFKTQNGNSTTDKTLSNVLIDLSASSTQGDVEKALAAAIKAREGVEVGKEFAAGTDTDAKIEVTVTEDEVETTYTYKKVTVKSVVKGAPVYEWEENEEDKMILESPYVDYTDAECQAVTLSDMYGESVTVTQTTGFQYRIYPIACIRLPDMSDDNLAGAVEEIIFSIFDESLSTGSLAAFKATEYAYTSGDETITVTDIILDLIDDKKAAETAEKERDTAKSALETATAAKDAAQTAYDEAEEADKPAKLEALNTATTKEQEAQETLNTKETALTDAEAKIAPALIMGKLNSCVNDDDETVVRAIYDEYYDAQYDALETEYNNEILEHVCEAVGVLFYDSVVYSGELPARAVKQAFKRDLEAYKYEYYEGTDENQKANTATYATFDDFLVAKAAALSGTEVADVDAAEDILRKETEAQVKDAIAVYVIADAIAAKYDDTDFKIKKKDVENYASIQAYMYNQQMAQMYAQFGMQMPASSYISAEYYTQIYGESNLRTAYLADLVLAFVTSTTKAADAEDFGGSDAIDFKNITYTFATDED